MRLPLAGVFRSLKGYNYRVWAAGAPRRREEGAIRLLGRVAEVAVEAVHEDRRPALPDGEGVSPEPQREAQPEPLRRRTGIARTARSNERLEDSIERSRRHTRTLVADRDAKQSGARRDGMNLDQHRLPRLRNLHGVAQHVVEPLAQQFRAAVDDRARCILVVPKTPAPGNPWSWRDLHRDHQPPAATELLARGYHLAFISPGPPRQRDAWVAFLTEKHRLSRKPISVGMSAAGELRAGTAKVTTMANPLKMAPVTKYGGKIVECQPGKTDVAKSELTMECTETTSGVASPARSR